MNHSWKKIYKRQFPYVNMRETNPQAMEIENFLLIEPDINQDCSIFCVYICNISMT